MASYEATFIWSLAMNPDYDTGTDANGAMDIGYAKIRFESQSGSGFTVVRGDYAGTYGGQPHYYFSLERDGEPFSEVITESYVYTSEDTRLDIQDNWAVGDNIGLSGSYSAYSFVSITEVGTGGGVSPAEIAALRAQITALQEQITALQEQLDDLQIPQTPDLAEYVKKTDLSDYLAPTVIV